MNSITGNEGVINYNIPTSVVKASRIEIDGLSLQIQKYKIHSSSKLIPIVPTVSKLPINLVGYYFVVGALSPPDIQVINGDGMIYRIEFADGKAVLKTRIAKTPCYYADQITQHRRYPKEYRFQDGGPSRKSQRLGGRNQLNTAFLQTLKHLLLTFDAGIPWIIDPDSMELIEPVGRMDNWLSITTPYMSLASSLREEVFPVHSNPAHPVCDHYQPQNSLPKCLEEQAKNSSNHFITLNYSTGYKGKYRKSIDSLLGWITRNVSRIGKTKITPYNSRVYGFTDLIKYSFDNRQLERWQLVLPDWDGKNPDVKKILIGEQSIHQMVITQDYIVLADIAFKLEFSQIFFPEGVGKLEGILDGILSLTNQLFKKDSLKENLLSWRLKWGYRLYSVFLKLIPPSQTGNFYIISRADLQKRSNNPGSNLAEQPKSIRVRKVTIPREVSHFTADYKNPNGKIILHVGHQNGTDVTEWLSKYDRFTIAREKGDVRKTENEPSTCRLAGMLTGPMDVSSLGSYVVDGQTGALLDSKVISDVEHTWWPSVYTHRDICRDRPEETEDQIKNLYWMCCGFPWEIVPDRIYQAYKDREFRVIHHTELPKTSKPCKLLRLDTQTTKIVDWFDFPRGYFACSPQFIPKSTPCPKGQDPSTHGYIVCVVLSDAPNSQAGTDKATPQDEFWIFDANNLGNRQYDDDGKPIKEPGSFRDEAVVYRLSHPSNLNMGLTIHSIWLSPEDFARNSSRYTSTEIRKKLREEAFWRDYGALIENVGEQKILTDEPGSPRVLEEKTVKKLGKEATGLFDEVYKAFGKQKKIEP